MGLQPHDRTARIKSFRSPDDPQIRHRAGVVDYEADIGSTEPYTAGRTGLHGDSQERW